VSAGNIFEALEPVIQVFDALGIRYQIGGSVASSAYGIARATLDVDLVANLNESQIRPFVDRLHDRYYVDEDRVRDAVERRSSFNIIHLESMLKVDVFILKSHPYDQAAFSRARLEKLEEGESKRQHYLASPEDVILNKLEWYRQGGCISERQWNDVLGVLKVQQSSLDMEYLRRWAVALNLIDILSRTLADAGMESAAGPAGDG
jgi:hypothetical protein